MDHEPQLDYESVSILIAPSKQGDQGAREALLAQMQDYVALMAHRHMDASLTPKAGLSDVAQETMTRVIENFDQFRGQTGAEFKGWVKQIVIREINRIRRSYRTAKRDIGRERQIAEKTSANAFDPSPMDTNPTPSSDAMAMEQIQMFYRVLDQLPPDYANVIRLRSIERLTFPEVAKQMQRSHDSVTKLWYRAILKFEETLRSNDIDLQVTDKPADD